MRGSKSASDPLTHRAWPFTFEGLEDIPAEAFFDTNNLAREWRPELRLRSFNPGLGNVEFID